MVETAVQDPTYDQYIPIGPEGFGYIEDPEYQRKRLMEEEIRKAAEIEKVRRGAAAAALTGAGTLREGMTPEAGAGLLVGGYADFEDLLPPAERGTSTDRGLPTYSQAEQIVEDYSYQGEDEEGNPIDLLTLAQRIAAIRALARGEPTGIPELDDVRPEAEIRAERMTEDLFDYLQGRGGTQRPTRQGAMTQDYINMVLKELSAYPEDEWREVLEASEYSEEEIKRILGR
jgi:hypothetical protein